MSLTHGSGPFGDRPAGRFNREIDPEGLFYLEESPKWIRARLGGETVVDSRNPRLLHAHNRLPVFWFAREDVRMDLLDDSDKRTTCAYKGFASYWHVGEEDDIAWTYLDPLHDALPVKALIAFFNERVDVEVDGTLEERPHTQWSR